MFCPNCRYEYLSGVTKCPDCGADLVAELPPTEKEEPPEEKWFEVVTIFESFDFTLIAVARSILEEAKIDYFPKSPDSDYRLSTYYGRRPIEIKVDENHAAEARELLKDLEKSEILPDYNLSEEDNEP